MILRSNRPNALPPGIGIRGDAGDQLTHRAHEERPHAYRNPFARDGARILHARAFRRLAGKTQVFTRLAGWGAPATGLRRWGDGGPPGDHFRSRLTHTLEVTQISRTVAGALGLNTDLAEALALVHDIGHPPFGHAGEKALDRVMRAQGLRFDHNLHALRIVTWFEERYPAFRGLNLTLGVREGIVKHSRDYDPAEYPELAEYLLDVRPPLEAQLIDLADEIAYLTADLDDGLDAGLLHLDQVRGGVPLFRRCHDGILREYPEGSVRVRISEALRRVFNVLVTDLINEVRQRVSAAGISTLEEVRQAPGRIVGLSAGIEAERVSSKEFLYANLYNSPEMDEDHRHSEKVVEGLFTVLMGDPGLLPADHQAQIAGQGLARTVTDYIAGMTDNFIEQIWTRVSPG